MMQPDLTLLQVEQLEINPGESWETMAHRLFTTFVYEEEFYLWCQFFHAPKGGVGTGDTDFVKNGHRLSDRRHTQGIALYIYSHNTLVRRASAALLRRA
jgi:hypothetical protein